MADDPCRAPEIADSPRHSREPTVKNAISPIAKSRGRHHLRRRGLLRSVSIVALTAVLGFSMAAGNLMGSTESAWQAEGHATGTLNAATVPAANLIRDCRYRPGVIGLGARVEVYWSTPEGYNLDDAQLWASTSGLGSVLAPLTGFNLRGNTTGSPGAYTTTVPTNLLGGLLGLGSELEVSIVMSRQGWTSEPASVATNAGLLAGIGGSCRNLA